jgi:hypothetical protein
MNIHRIHLNVVPDVETAVAAASDLALDQPELSIQEVLKNDEKEKEATQGIHRGADSGNNRENI